MQNSHLNPLNKDESPGDDLPVRPRVIMDDTQVWERFKKGDKAALTFIYRNYSNALFNYGCQFTPNRELVKDAIQDLFIEIINHRENLGTTDSIKYYLFKSLRNKLVRLLSKSNQVNVDNERHSQFQISISPEVIMINRQIDEQKRNLISRKLNELPPLQKEVLLLFYFEGLTYEQISGILGMKIKSARALVYRAIRSLAKLINPVKDQLL